MAVALTIAMLLQNSVGVLATDGVAPVSDAIQGQSTEQQNTDAVLKQTDEGNSQQETKAPETPGSETPAQTEAPQTDAPKPEATETDVPKTDATETDVPQADTPQTSAPETQETPGLTLPDGETDNGTSNGENDNADISENGSTTEIDSSVVYAEDYAKSGDENIEDANDGIMPIAGSNMIKVEFDANGGTWETAPTLKVKINGTNETEITLEATNSGKTKYKVPDDTVRTFPTGGATIIWKPAPVPTQAGKRFLYWEKRDMEKRIFTMPKIVSL